MNYDCKENPEPCTHCVLMQLVPPGFRPANTPCRYISMNEAGETLDTLYRYDNQPEIEETVEKWLRATIAALEETRRLAQSGSRRHLPEPDSAEMQGTPLFQRFHPKCANPACPTPFHWLGGGKFFRFRPGEVAEGTDCSAQDAPKNLHGVKHFRLCERCSHVFTLTHDPQHGIVLRLQPKPARNCRQSLALDAELPDIGESHVYADERHSRPREADRSTPMSQPGVVKAPSALDLGGRVGASSAGKVCGEYKWRWSLYTMTYTSV